MHPSDEKRFEAIRQKEHVQNGLADAFTTSCSQRNPVTHKLPTAQQEGYPAMIKLNCGVSRKVGEPNYGSRGASVNVELELDSATVQDPKLLHEKIRKIFALAKTSVDEELGVTPATGTPPASNQPVRPTKIGGRLVLKEAELDRVLEKGDEVRGRGRPRNEAK
jgi:hypothetical protein